MAVYCRNNIQSLILEQIIVMHIRLRVILKNLSINIFFCIFLFIVAALCYMNLTKGHNWGDDFSAYIMQAKSIVEGKPLDFIKTNRFTVEQSSRPMGPIVYPWGYPVLLAPVYAIFGSNMIALKSVSVACFLTFILVLWIAFRKYHSIFWRFLFCCLFAFNPFLIEFLNSILSDIPFLLFSTVSIMLMGTVIIERRRLFSHVLDPVVLGAVIAIAFFIRTNGLILLITLGMTQCIMFLSNIYYRKSKNHDQSTHEKLIPVNHNIFGSLFINLTPYLSFVILCALWHMILPGGGSGHVPLLNMVSYRSVSELIYYNMELPADFFSNFPNKYIMYGVTIPLVLSGVMRRWRSDFQIIIYIVLTFILYSIWPGRQGLRFLFPILPFYFSFMITSLEKASKSNLGVRKLFYKIIYVFPIIAIISYFAYSTVQSVYINIKANRCIGDGPYMETSKDMFTYISDNVESASTIIFFKPRLMKMMTGRKSIMINKPEEVTRGQYLCFYNKDDERDQVSINDIKNLMAKRYIELVFKNNDFKIYRVLNSSPYE